MNSECNKQWSNGTLLEFPAAWLQLLPWADVKSSKDQHLWFPLGEGQKQRCLEADVLLALNIQGKAAVCLKTAPSLFPKCSSFIPLKNWFLWPSREEFDTWGHMWGIWYGGHSCENTLHKKPPCISSLFWRASPTQYFGLKSHTTELAMGRRGDISQQGPSEWPCLIQKSLHDREVMGTSNINLFLIS